MTLKWVIVVGVLAVVLCAMVIIPLLIEHEPKREFRPTEKAIQTIAFAQLDYFENDRDKNGVKDYWKKDIAGLYAKLVDGRPLQLIELGVAGADKTPVVDIAHYTPNRPRIGYWYQAIPTESEDYPDPSKFAVCAFPKKYDTGLYTYIVSNDAVVYRKVLEREGGISVYPQNPISDDWEQCD